MIVVSVVDYRLASRTPIPAPLGQTRSRLCAGLFGSGRGTVRRPTCRGLAVRQQRGRNLAGRTCACALRDQGQATAIGAQLLIYPASGPRMTGESLSPGRSTERTTSSLIADMRWVLVSGTGGGSASVLDDDPYYSPPVRDEPGRPPSGDHRDR